MESLPVSHALSLDPVAPAARAGRNRWFPSLSRAGTWACRRLVP